MTFIQLKTTTVDSWNAASQLGLVAICLQGLIHPSWCRSSSITVCLTLCSIWPPWKLLPQVTMFHPSRSNSLRVWLKQMLHWTHQCLSRQNDWIHWWLSLPSDCCFVCFFVGLSILCCHLWWILESWQSWRRGLFSVDATKVAIITINEPWWILNAEAELWKLKENSGPEEYELVSWHPKKGDFWVFFGWLIFVAIHVDIHPGRKARSVNFHRVVTILPCLSHSFVLAQHEPWGQN